MNHENGSTPAWAVRALLAAEDARDPEWRRSTNVLEPAAGDGAILRALLAADPSNLVYWRAIEPRLECLPELARLDRVHIRIGDYLAEPHAADIIITNPPTAQWEQFLSKALVEAPLVYFWAPVARLAVAARVLLPTDLLIVPFLGSYGQLSCDYAWFLWRRSAFPLLSTIHRAPVVDIRTEPQ